MLFRIRLLDVPLERDEGIYAYVAQPILHGIPPYIESFDVKMPGLYAAYALVMAIFGQSIRGIHFGLLMVNAGTIILLFLLAKRLFGNLAGIVTAASYAILSLGQEVQGIFANAEHFVLLAAIGGVVLLLQAIKSGRLLTILLSGVLFGAAFIIKQTSVVFILFGGLYLVYSLLRVRPIIWSPILLKCVLFSIGVLLPFILCCFILWQGKAFDNFWFWTFIYPKLYISVLSLSSGLNKLKYEIFRIIGQAVLLWVLAGIGLTAIAWSKKARSQAPFILMFFLLSFLSVCPGLYFRPHYFIFLLPATALLVGTSISSITERFSKSHSAVLKKAVPSLLVFIVIFHSVYTQRVFLFQMNPEQVSRLTYGANPFPESLRIAEYIKKHSTKSDYVAVFGSEPQINFYSGRRSPTRHITTYQMMLKHKYAAKMQQEMILEIESARPKFLIFVSIPTSWMINPDSERMIFTWFNQYQQKYYNRVGIIDIISDQNTVYRWGQESLDYSPLSKYWVAVFERID